MVLSSNTELPPDLEMLQAPSCLYSCFNFQFPSFCSVQGEPLLAIQGLAQRAPVRSLAELIRVVTAVLPQHRPHTSEGNTPLPVHASLDSEFFAGSSLALCPGCLVHYQAYFRTCSAVDPGSKTKTRDQDQQSGNSPNLPGSRQNRDKESIPFTSVGRMQVK